jgi:hypothetical protein
MAKRNRPSFGRSKAERGLDQLDTPIITEGDAENWLQHLPAMEPAR